MFRGFLLVNVNLMSTLTDRGCTVPTGLSKFLILLIHAWELSVFKICDIPALISHV